MDLSAVTIQQLRYVLAVERHRSFREAAQAVHVSQPALSMQVKKLEELLGVCVFDRSRQPVLVTERGKRVLHQIRIAVEHFERLGAVASGAEKIAGSFRLGVIPTLLPTFVPLFLKRFSETYPDVDLDVVEEKTPLLLRALREGALDGGIAATPLDVAGVHEHPICRERFFAYLAPGHSLAGRARVKQADLIDEQVWLLGEGHCFRAQVLHLCEADRGAYAGAGRNVRCECGSFEALMGVVDSGFGLTILPELVVRSLPKKKRDAQVRPFASPEPVREVSLLTVRSQERAAVAAALLGVLRTTVPNDLATKRAHELLRPA